MSETPLDLDALRAALTEARGYAAKVKKPMFPPASVVQLVDIALSLIRELEARPRTPEHPQPVRRLRVPARQGRP